MTREEARKAAEVMMAYGEGKEIEFKDIIYNNGVDDYQWTEVSDPTFDWLNFEYRIKSEPKYRPFKTKAECWKEMGKHPSFGWLKNKKNGDAALIGNVCQDKEVLITWALNHETNYASDLFNDWVFADETPFGIKEN